MNDIRRVYRYIQDKIILPQSITLDGPTGPIVSVENKDILMLGSYNYLGLANNKALIEEAIKTISTFGAGTGGVRILTGTMSIHKKLDREVADFTGYEDSLSIASGYGANVGVIPGFINLMGMAKSIFFKKSVILSDEYNHASIVDGCRLANAKIEIYKHNDVKDLEKLVSKYKRYRKLIVTDGVFSMDGDIAPLNAILDIAKVYDASTMVDDAHAVGIIGDHGAGTASYFGRPGQVTINMGTFSKGLGVSGGFISGSSDLINYMRLACRSYMFSDALAPGVVGAVRESLRYVRSHPEIIEDLSKKSDYFRSKLNAVGFNTFKSRTQIIPILIGDQKACVKFAERLLEEGLFAPAIRWPAVPKNLSRIRFAVSASHSYEQLDFGIQIITRIGKEFKIID